MSKDRESNMPKDTQAEKNLESQDASKLNKNPEAQEASESNRHLKQEARPTTSRWQPGPETGLNPDDGLDADVVKDAVEVLQVENAQLREQLLRTVADMDNLRKRTEKEKSNTAKYAISNFARDILGVGDNMRRAIEAVPEDASINDSALKTLIEGVEMTERELLAVLDRHGIKQINPLGEPFDPNLHQAVFEDPNPELAAGLCSTVIQPGYIIEDRILRPAMVGVSKGGNRIPKTERNSVGSTGQPGASDQNEIGSQSENQENSSRQGRLEGVENRAKPQTGVGDAVDGITNSDAGTRTRNDA